MFLPLSTDAPIYHRPYATVGMIAANVAAFVWMANANEDVVVDALLFRGDGLHPLQWMTSNFLHGGFWHLATNMAFVWVFGIIVEGKIGPWKFAACYLGIGVAECAIEQIVGLAVAEVSVSFGASAIVFGLIGMSLVWAPANEVTIGYWILYRIGAVDVSVKVAAIAYTVLELLFATGEVIDGELGSSGIHLIGGVIGFALGAFMLKRGWVDCEGWDLFSRRKGRSVRRAEESEAELADPEAEELEAEELGLYEPTEREADRAVALELLAASVSENDLDAAWVIHSENSSLDDEWKLPRRSLMALVGFLNRAKRWHDLRPLLVESIVRVPERANPRKLLLARIWLEVDERVSKGREILASIEKDGLGDVERVHYTKLTQKADELEELGVPDLGLDD